MIEPTRELGSFMPDDGCFSNMERISERTSEIRSKLNCGFGKDGVKGRDERKVRALDTVLPKQTLPHALFTTKDPKKSLDKADAAIHGVTIYGYVLNFRASSCPIHAETNQKHQKSQYLWAEPVNADIARESCDFLHSMGGLGSRSIFRCRKWKKSGSIYRPE
jgi:hypothetical protein